MDAYFYWTTLMIAPLVVFLLVAAIIAGSLSWPYVAGGLFILALLAHALPAFLNSTAEDDET